MPSLADRLKPLRKGKNMTQKAMAELLNCTDRHLFQPHPEKSRRQRPGPGSGSRQRNGHKEPQADVLVFLYLLALEVGFFLDRHYQKIEYGQINVPATTVILLADYFGVSAIWTSSAIPNTRPIIHRQRPFGKGKNSPPPCFNTGAEDCILAEPKCAKQTKLCKLGFTAYVLLRKTQSSVSLRLTAPFKRSLALRGTIRY